jgi:endonuclease/exonuclease/phosphatase family metal-dependent hydrolase
MFRVATFNAGLAVGVLPNVTERLPLVIEALAALDVDLLFVQEFWLESHWQALQARVSHRMPHGLRPPARETAMGGCTPEALLPLKTCADQHCAGLRDEALALCMVRHCQRIALSLRGACLNCIASRPEGTLDEILARCSSASGAEAAGGLMAYGGSFGTGLLLRTPPLEHATLLFQSSINARGAIYARINNTDWGELNVFATHLSPGGSEQPGQVEQLLAWIDQKAAGRPCLLLGDLNTSPGSELFRRIQAAGFREADDADARGTFSSGSLLNGQFGASSWRLDHVLSRDVPARTSTRRILDAPLQMQVSGRKINTTLSDHAGVAATFS